MVRALACQAKGRRFETAQSRHGGVAQWLGPATYNRKMKVQFFPPLPDFDNFILFFISPLGGIGRHRRYAVYKSRN